MENTTTTIAVSGLSCNGCVAGLTNHLRDVEGVVEVHVDLRPNATSSLTISHRGLAESALRSEVVEAGFTVLEPTRTQP